MNKAKTLLSILLFSICISMNAQISPEIMDVLKKCDEKMDAPEGIEIDMNAHIGMLVLSMNGTVKSYSKNEKSLTSVTLKALGKEMTEVNGYDGEQEWTYQTKSDSLIITKKEKKEKGDYDIDLDLHEEYNTAKMKVKDGNYEITFTNPKTKDAPKKTEMIISNDYFLKEISMKQGPISMKMTITNIKIGVNDNVFKLDMSKYPTAKVVRK